MNARRSSSVCIRLAAFGLVGAAITLSVACGLWLGIREKSGRRSAHLLPTSAAWPCAVPVGWPAVQQRWESVAFSWGYEHWDAIEVNEDRRVVKSVEVDRYRVGIPFRALEMIEIASGLPNPARTNDGYALNGPLRGLMSIGSRPRALPIRPVVAGFALDSAVYGTLAFAVWSVPRVIRRHRRRARGHCPACGYDLKGSPSRACTECGA